MALKKYVKQFFKVIYLHCVHTPPSPPFCLGFNLLPNFQIKVPDRISIIRGRLLEKRGDFSGGGRGCSFYIKNKLKSDILNDKKNL